MARPTRFEDYPRLGDKRNQTDPDPHHVVDPRPPPTSPWARMARPTRFEDYRWLGDKRNQRAHDLDHVVDSCRLDELMTSEQFAAFGPDTLAEAPNRGYRPCPHCAAAPAPA